MTEEGLIEGCFIPKEAPAPGTAAANRLSSGIKLIEVSPSEGKLRIFPIHTLPKSDKFLGPKYQQINTLVLPVDVEADADLGDILETLPSGFTKDFEYGLGLTQDCEVLINLIEEYTNCSVIQFVSFGDPQIAGDTFLISFTRFNVLRTELVRIKNRGKLGIRRVKETHVHNDLAGVLGLKPKLLSLGRFPMSKWMTRVAAGEEPISSEEQDALLETTTANAAQIASKAPAKMVRLQHKIELVNLEQLIVSYKEALDGGYNEPWWQKFFEENVFALQLLFGGPTVFVDAQVPIGEGSNAVKGKKIGDYLLKNSLTNNAALVEIKKPGTKLMRRRPYREGVYGIQAEIDAAIIQVLDQALQLTRHEADTKTRTDDASWTSNAPRCFVVAGLTTELDSDDKKKSFELYREHLAGVRLVTYDEVLGQLTTLREFLAAAEVGDLTTSTPDTATHDYGDVRSLPTENTQSVSAVLD